jgi:hypothetical protein
MLYNIEYIYLIFHVKLETCNKHLLTFEKKNLKINKNLKLYKCPIHNLTLNI